MASVTSSRRAAIANEERGQNQKHILEVINRLNDEELKRVTEMLKDDDIDNVEEKEDVNSDEELKIEDVDDMVKIEDEDGYDLASIQVPNEVLSEKPSSRASRQRNMLIKSRISKLEKQLADE